jgi:hypothetical protein
MVMIDIIIVGRIFITVPMKSAALRVAAGLRAQPELSARNSDARLC